MRWAFAVSLALLTFVITTVHVRAVAATFSYDSSTQTYNATYDTTVPDDSTVTNWDSGWGASGVTGWNYVGNVNGASGVYLGDGYVLTAAHVGAGDIVLDGQTYDAVSSGVQIGTSDLSLFRISTTSTTGTVLNLPPLTLSSAANPPTAFGLTSGSAVVMIGYGGLQGESWGEDHVNEINQTTVVNSTYTSLDFYTLDGTTSNRFASITNNAQLVAGDSGGGDFIYNSATGEWELAGINEVQLENESMIVTGSGMVQISDYSSVIEADMVPEPPAWMLASVGGILLLFARLLRRILLL